MIEIQDTSEWIWFFAEYFVKGALFGACGAMLYFAVKDLFR